MSVVFFFQAEDGIRDSSVTGVQTCALPIWAASQPLRGQLLEKSFFRVAGTVAGTAVGVGLVLLAQGNLLWLGLGLAVWLGLCAGVGNLQGRLVAYRTMRAGYSAARVARLALP